MITPEMIEAAKKLVARADSILRTDAAGNKFRMVFADDLSTLEAALALHKPAMPEELESLIERLDNRVVIVRRWPECTPAVAPPPPFDYEATASDLDEAAAALRSLVLEVERLQSQVDELLGSMKLDGRYLSDISALRERIAQLEAALAAAKAKPLAMPEGLPEGPWTVEDWRDTEFNAFRVEAADSTVIAIVQDEVCARTIASLPNLYAELAKAVAMADELWIAREQMRDELDAARNKTIEECAKSVAHLVDGDIAASCIRALATGETR